MFAVPPKAMVFPVDDVISVPLVKSSKRIRVEFSALIQVAVVLSQLISFPTSTLPLFMIIILLSIRILPTKVISDPLAMVLLPEVKNMRPVWA